MIEKIRALTDNKEVINEVEELLNVIPLLYYMSNERPTAKDLQKDSEGKIIVDITRPHVLVDMDYFRQPAINFLKNGRYTNFFPSRAPSSPYRKFWDEEIRRCKEGYIRESDGEWIPGYYYFYLNYCPILKAEIVDELEDANYIQAEHVEGFPDVWDGDYLFFHYVHQAEKRGEHCSVLKARGKGYSYKAAAILNRNYHLFKRSKNFAFAADKEYLISDGLLNKVWNIHSFIVEHVGFAKRLALTDSLPGMHLKSGYKKIGDTGEYGFKSEIIGVSLKNDPDKARGKRAKMILWEESGSLPNLLKSWRLAQPSVASGRRVFGLMIAFGTGGEEGADFVGLESLFYHPETYQIYRLSNVWDKNSEASYCGFFVPDYLNKEDCYDKNGNSDVIKAVVEVITERVLITKGASDATDIAQVKAEKPFTPQESVMRTEGTVFPVAAIKEYLISIKPNLPHFLGPHYVGELNWTQEKMVTFRPRFDITPIREWPYRGRDKRGAIEIFDLPKTTPGLMQPEWGRYIGGIDPVDDDEGTSLFSIEIFDLLTDTVVAEWTGRFDRADLNFEQALKLAVFYNAELNYENKLKGTYDFFNRMNALKYLATTPENLKDMEYVKQLHVTGNKAYGTPPTPAINSWGRRLQADWMMTPNMFDQDGKLNLHRTRSIGYLEECMRWNHDGNFDRVSRSNMTFILRASKLKYIENRRQNIQPKYNEDPFFQNNNTISRGSNLLIM